MWKRQRRCYILIWQKYDLSDNSDTLVYEWAQLTAGLLWCWQTLLLWEILNKIQLELFFKSHILLKAYWITLASYPSGTLREINTFSGVTRHGQICVSIHWLSCTLWHLRKMCAIKRHEKYFLSLISFGLKSLDGGKWRPDRGTSFWVISHCLKVSWGNLETNTTLTFNLWCL